MVRLVNNSRGTQNFIRNESQYAICVFSPCVFITKFWKLSLCVLIWLMTCNYSRLDGGHCDGSGHRKMALQGRSSDGFLVMLFKKKLHRISNLTRSPDWLVHSGSYIFIRLRSLWRVPIAHSAGMLGLHLLNFCDVIMDAMASQITSLTIVYWTLH